MKKNSLATYALAALASFGLTFGSLNQSASAEDYYLTIAGGYSPSGNQASLEKNVLFFQRMLADQKLDSRNLDIYFADGKSNNNTLQVKDLDRIPQANRLMAEFFSTTRNLGLYYRPHKVPNIQGGTTRENISDWFETNGPKMKSGDRLMLYVSAHGGASKNKSKPHDTTIYLWNNKYIKVSELAAHLDKLPEGVKVVTVMVQCHAGGFARLLFDQADPEKGASKQQRVGFFATVHSRPAAGCTPEVNEKDYKEYSSYFWSALAGETRTGEQIDLPDYDENGFVSFAEAHAYTILTSDTIDLPIKTSGEYLRSVSKFADDRDEESELLGKEADYSKVLELAGPVDRIILETLSEKLNLSGEARIATARKEGKRSTRSSRSSRGSFSRGRRGPTSERAKLKMRIAADVKRKWPSLGNVLNPESVELVTTKSKEFVKAIETHKDYAKYRKLMDAQGAASKKLSPTESKVKYERFVRIAENVILSANLESVGSDSEKEAYARLVAGEFSSLHSN